MSVERLNALLDAVGEQRVPARAAGGRPGPGPDEELGSLPFTRKQDLLADQAGASAVRDKPDVSPRALHPPQQTSGTTGPDAPGPRHRRGLGVVVLSSRGCCARRAGAGDRVALAYSFGPYIQFWACHAGVLEIGAMAIPLGGMESVQRLATIASRGHGDPGHPQLRRPPGQGRASQRPERLARVRAAGRVHRRARRVAPSLRGGSRRWGGALPRPRRPSEVGSFAYPCDAAGGMHLHEDEFVVRAAGPPGRRPSSRARSGSWW